MGLLRRLRSSFRGKRRRTDGAGVTNVTARHNGAPVPMSAAVSINAGSTHTPAASARTGNHAATVNIHHGTISEITLPQLVIIVRELQSELRELRATVTQLQRCVQIHTNANALRRAVSLVAASREELFFDALSASLVSLGMRDTRPGLRNQLSMPEGGSDVTVEVSRGTGDCVRDRRSEEQDTGADAVKAGGKSGTLKEDGAHGKSDEEPGSAKDTPLVTGACLDSSNHAEAQANHTPSNGDPPHSNSNDSPATGDVQLPEEPPLKTTAAPSTTALPASVTPATAQCHGNCRHLGHPLAEEIDRVITSQLAMAASDVDGDAWSLFAQDGQMKMYRQEVPANNYSVDPLKAVHHIVGVTARELCRHYWDADVRLDWETTVDKVSVLARLDPSTLLVHQVHRRIWPAQQRDTLFWSHLCRRRIAGTEWSIVVNHSVKEHPLEPPQMPGCVRAIMTSCLAGHTEPERVPRVERGELKCHLAYSSQVEPGGWAPTAGLRLVYKREYPRFLKTFTNYVMNKCRDDPEVEW